MMKSFLQVSSD